MFVASIDRGARWEPIANGITLGELRKRILALKLSETELLVESDGDYYCSATVHGDKLTLVWG